MKKIILATILVVSASVGLNAYAKDSMNVKMNLIDAQGISAEIGEIAITKAKKGLVFTPNLKGLPAGQHGFHIHENPSCDAKDKNGEMTAGEAAGEHYDPKMTKKHAHPNTHHGHLGDLPALMVDSKGNATKPVTAPRLTMDDIKNKALMIHAGGDNYSDKPQPAGGGGKRMACGVIVSQ